jgi:hypothetical protein
MDCVYASQAIAPETNETRDDGLEDGCTGINKVAGENSCAPHDWYGEYTSARTGKTYNTGDDPTDWQVGTWICVLCAWL